MGSVVVSPDDPLVATLGVEPGSYQACGECVARFDPSKPYRHGTPRKPHKNIAGTVGDLQAYYLNNLYCALCRLYAREEEADVKHEVRLVCDEFQPPVPDPLGGTHEEGCYRCCRACWSKFRPAVFERWKATGVIPIDTPFVAFTQRSLS